MASPSIMNVSRNVSKKYGTTKSDAMNAAGSEEPQAKEDTGSNDSLIAKALIGLAPIALGAAFGGETGGAIGAQAGQKGLGIMDEQAKTDKENAVARAAAAAHAKEKAFDQQMKMSDHELKQQELALKERELSQKSRETMGVEGKLAKLSGDKAGRLDNSKAALGAVVGMKKALIDANQNTFSPIGENDFTLNSNIFEEMLGRMQSGGAISAGEMARFKALRPGVSDSKEMQGKKLASLESMMRSRIETLGFKPEDFPEVVAAYNAPTPSKGGLPSLGGNMFKGPEANAADPNVAEYAKSHGITVEQASTILYNRGYRGQ